MPTIWEIADQLTAVYWRLWERSEPSLEGALDELFAAVGDLDILAGGIPMPSVRAMLDGEPSRDG